MWYENLYIHESIKENKKQEIINNISKNKNIFNVYCLCITNKLNFQLEILSTNELFREKKRDTKILIIGLAKGKDQALMLLTNIVQEIYENTGAVNIKQYFL